MSRVEEAKEELEGHVVREAGDADDGRPCKHFCILAFTLNYIESYGRVLNIGIR